MFQGVRISPRSPLKHNPHKFSSLNEVFQQYLAPDAETPTYVPRSFSLRVEDAIELTHAAGGKAVLAHPGSYKRVGNFEDALRRMAESGLDGLEVFYPYFFEVGGGMRDRFIPRFAELAARFGLFATGGQRLSRRAKKTIGSVRPALNGNSGNGCETGTGGSGRPASPGL